jgi:hypothetical protein
MKYPFAVLICGLMSACSVSEETPGSVSGVVNGFVTVSGPKAVGEPATPTARMIAQAQEVCPGALYRSARPSTTDYGIYDYLFKCVNSTPYPYS